MRDSYRSSLCAKECNRAVKCVGLSKWKTEIKQKKTREWFKEKEVPMYVNWYDGSLGGDLFRGKGTVYGR